VERERRKLGEISANLGWGGEARPRGKKLKPGFSSDVLLSACQERRGSGGESTLKPLPQEDKGSALGSSRESLTEENRRKPEGGKNVPILSAARTPRVLKERGGKSLGQGLSSGGGT